MTIFDYTSLPTIVVPFILRDIGSPTGVYVTNQETKERIFCEANDTSVFLDGYFTIDITELIDGVDINTSLLVMVVESDGNPLYRDIVVFEDRIDTELDYEQNDTDNEYVFV